MQTLRSQEPEEQDHFSTLLVIQIPFIQDNVETFYVLHFLLILLESSKQLLWFLQSLFDPILCLLLWRTRGMPVSCEKPGSARIEFSQIALVKIFSQFCTCKMHQGQYSGLRWISSRLRKSCSRNQQDLKLLVIFLILWKIILNSWDLSSNLTRVNYFQEVTFLAHDVRNK